MTKSFAEQINSARLMLSGLKENAEKLKSIGVTEDDIASLNAVYGETTALDEKQERLKSELKTCTSELSDKSKQLNTLVANMKKRVKLVIPQTEWKGFGIGDTK